MISFYSPSLPPRPLISALHGSTPPPRRAAAVPAPTPPNENNLCADTLQAEGGGGRRRGLRSWLTKSDSLAHFSFSPPLSLLTFQTYRRALNLKRPKVARRLRPCTLCCETPPLPRWMVSAISGCFVSRVISSLLCFFCFFVCFSSGCCTPDECTL